jgi:hypothetical protein
MRSLGTYTPPEAVGLQFERLAIPHGSVLPRAPIAGELFLLEVDMPEPLDASPWYHRGLYMSTGFGWTPLAAQLSKQKSCAIGAQTHEVEVLGTLKDVPRASDGFNLAAVAITPASKRTLVSGVGTFWVSLDADGYVIVSVFRGQKFVGLTVDSLKAGDARTITMSFMDAPNSAEQQVYSLRVNSTVKGNLHVNCHDKFNFDGMSQTAFIVSENN